MEQHWEKAKETLDMLVQARLNEFNKPDTAELSPSNRDWVWIGHKATVYFVEKLFRVDPCDPRSHELAMLFGRPLVDVFEFPSDDHLESACAICFCAQTSLGIRNLDRPSLFEAFLWVGSVMYGQTTEFFQNWLEFSRQERLTQNDPEFLGRLGTRVYLQLCQQLGVLEKTAAANNGMVSRRAATVCYEFVRTLANEIGENYERLKAARSQS